MLEWTKLITNNSQTWTDENLIICTENKTKISFLWYEQQNNLNDWMVIFKVIAHIIICSYADYIVYLLCFI